MTVAILWLAWGAISPTLVASATIRVEPAEVRLYRSGTQQLLVTRGGEREFDETATAEYSSTNSEIATVSAGGVIRAMQSGSTLIEVRARGTFNSVQVTVAPADEGSRIRFATASGEFSTGAIRDPVRQHFLVGERRRRSGARLRRE